MGVYLITAPNFGLSLHRARLLRLLAPSPPPSTPIPHLYPLPPPSKCLSQTAQRTHLLRSRPSPPSSESISATRTPPFLSSQRLVLRRSCLRVKLTGGQEGTADCIANEDGERQIACAIAFHGEELVSGLHPNRCLFQGFILVYQNPPGKHPVALVWREDAEFRCHEQVPPLHFLHVKMSAGGGREHPTSVEVEFVQNT